MTRVGWPIKAASRRYRSLWRDERGGTAVQAIVFLPVIILSMVVLMYLMETIAIRQSLHTGTYLATRFLSLYPLESTDTGQWGLVAQKFVYAELRNNPWVHEDRLNDVFAPVVVSLANGNDCGAVFTVTAGYEVFAPINDTDSRFLPGLDRFALEDVRDGKVVCKR